VERVFGANHPDPLEIEKAKKVLKVRRENPPKSLAMGCCLSWVSSRACVTFPALVKSAC
jgi:hypothetical protein